MLNTVSSCYDQLETLQKLKNLIGPETWCDCLRLIERCDVFRNFLKDLLNSIELLEDLGDKEERCLNDLEKTLLDAEAYVKEFVNRTDFFGITEASFRQGCSTDFSKICRNLLKLAQDLCVGGEPDHDKIRVQDMEVSNCNTMSFSFSHSDHTMSIGFAQNLAI